VKIKGPVYDDALCGLSYGTMVELRLEGITENVVLATLHPPRISFEVTRDYYYYYYYYY
jgi:hypothetical protein